MPKKSHSARRFKSPQIARAQSPRPAAGEGSSSKSVNEILANMRRSHPPAPGSVAPQHMNEPTLPPSLRQILQIPETPPPRPRAPQRTDANGRRMPAGPPPPRSWQEPTSQMHPSFTTAHARPPSTTPAVKPITSFSQLETSEPIPWPEVISADPLPGCYLPYKHSFVGMLLRLISHEWDFHRSYNRFHLYQLPARYRVALISYLNTWYDGAITTTDLRLLLTTPSPKDLENCDDSGYELPEVDNQEVNSLNLSETIGKHIKVKELSDLLFPSQHENQTAESEPQDSWDAVELPPLRRPPQLLPNLTHLSLAVATIPPTPSIFTARPSPELPSWKEFLALSAKLPSITHLSLVHWPQPTMTPNTKFMEPLVSEDDWLEEVMILRRLSKNLYRLEYLDLTGCLGWCRALTSQDSAGNTIDWVGDWGQVTVLKLGVAVAASWQSLTMLYGTLDDICSWPPMPPPQVPLTDCGEKSGMRFDILRRIERHIRSQRAGKGRPITVMTHREDL